MNGAATTTVAASVSSGQATGIVRLIDVVRQNKYYMRIILDADKLSKAGIEANDVVTALRPLVHTVIADPDVKPAEGQPQLTWLAIFGGRDSAAHGDHRRPEDPRPRQPKSRCVCAELSSRNTASNA